MQNVGVELVVSLEGQKHQVGWSKVTGNLIWDVNMDFTRKARWVLNGHKTPDPIGSTYAGILSSESRGFNEIGYVPKSRVIFKKNR